MRRSILDVAALRRVEPGGDTEIWRGRLDGVEVAVKRSPPGAAADRVHEQLEREAVVQAASAHSHVLPLIAVLADPDPASPALVTRWRAGGSLADQLADQLAESAPPWTVDEVAGLLIAMGEAVVALHAAGYSHGDLSPTNVLLDEVGAPCLADFGSARALTAAVETSACRTDVVALGLLGRWLVDRLGLARGEADPKRADRAEAGALLQLLDACVGGASSSDGGSDGGSDPGALSGWVASLRRRFPRAEGCFHVPDRVDVEPLPGRIRTVEFGPRPSPTTGAESVARKRPALRERALALGGAGLVASVVGLGLISAPRSTHRDNHQRLTVATTTRLPRGACPTRPARARTNAAGARFDADVLGTGCPQMLVWDHRVLMIEPADGAPVERFRLGRPGDQLLLGRWRCTARDSVAIYRPGTGEVFEYPALPATVGARGAVAPRRSDSGVTAGVAAVVVGRAGCDEVVVTRPPDGHLDSGTALAGR